MTSYTGYITYIQYTTGTAKGETPADYVINDPFRLGDPKVTEKYTSDAVVEGFTAASTPAAVAVAWNPVVRGIFTTITRDSGVVEIYNDNPINPTTYTSTELATITKHDYKLIKTSDNTVTYGDFDSDGKIPASAQTASTDYKVAYRYDNVVIPQQKLPTLKAEMKGIALVAKARRIAIYYSQIAAFQAKTDYGFDLGDQLAEKAAGQLSYEIDNEVITLLDKVAGTAETDLTWSKTLPIGVSKAQHYEGFAEIVGIANQLIYDKTQRFAATYMLIASNILPILSFIGSWKPASTGTINGPYFAGTLGSLKVYVSPALAAGRYLIGVNGNDFMTSVAVWAPYMPIVPTQLLQFADGGTSQGFSTLYDLKVLNEDLIVAGQVTA